MANLKHGDLFVRHPVFGRGGGLCLVVDAERFGSDTSAITAVELNTQQVSWELSFQRSEHEAVGHVDIAEGAHRHWASTSHGRAIKNSTIEGMRKEIEKGLRALFGRYPQLLSEMLQSPSGATLMRQILLEMAHDVSTEQ